MTQAWNEGGFQIHVADAGFAEAARISLLAEDCADPKGRRLTFQVELLKDLAGGLFDLRAMPQGMASGDWLTLPGLFYGDNAWEPLRTSYPTGMDKAWSFRADASPCPGLHFPGETAGLAIFLEKDRILAERSLKSRLREGMDDVPSVGWSLAGTERAFRLCFPCQEEPHSYPHCNKLEPPLQPRLDFKKGDRFSVTLYAVTTGPGRAAYQQACAALAQRFKPATLAYDPAWVSKTAELFAHCLKKSHFRPGKGFSHRSDNLEIQSGWCGGFAAVEAALEYGGKTGDAELVSMGETMADFLCAEGLMPCGIFQSVYWEDRWLEKIPWAQADGAHARCPSEGTLFLGRLLLAEKARGRERPLWRKAFFSNLDAVLKQLDGRGSLALQFEGMTGKVLDREGATPGIWAGSLAIGSVLSGQAQYLDAAKKVGAFYLKEYIAQEKFFGGPYDTYKAPNMEDPYGLLVSYLELYKVSGDKDHLRAAKACADHLISWQYAYDTVFPEGTVCRTERVSTWGMAPASVRNRHIQNWESAAGSSLLELSALLAEPKYRERVLLHLQQGCQLVERGEGKLEIPLGGQSEQWYATEFRWFGDCGDYGKGNMWRISVCLPKAGFLNTFAYLMR